jgi:hypothetical protein
VSRALIVIASDAERQKAKRWLSKAPWNTRVTFQAPKRSLPQNDRLWASLTDIAEQLTWHGMKFSANDWKIMFLAALGGEMRLVPNIHGNGFVDLGRSSSRLSKAEFSDLLEIIHAFAAEHGVILGEPSEPDANTG